jgi:hypothetical protein
MAALYFFGSSGSAVVAFSASTSGAGATAGSTGAGIVGAASVVVAAGCSMGAAWTGISDVGATGSAIMCFGSFGMMIFKKLRDLGIRTSC